MLFPHCRRALNTHSGKSLLRCLCVNMCYWRQARVYVLVTKKMWESANLHVIRLAWLWLRANSFTYACFMSTRLWLRVHACNLLQLECEADFTELSRCRRSSFGFCIKGGGEAKRMHTHICIIWLGSEKKREEGEVLLHLITCRSMHHAATSSFRLETNQ